MKALILAVLAVVGMTASAQQRGAMLERLQTELGLSAEQTAQVEEIFAAQAEKRRAASEESRTPIANASLRSASARGGRRRMPDS